MEKTDVAIIGAGPNGMAVAAHLEASGIDRRIFGSPFSTWRHRMPKGMFLKSEPYASNIAAPGSGYQVRDYCRAEGLPYIERKQPLSLETFLSYGDWFASALVPDVEQVTISSVKPADGGFRLATDSGEEIWARHVVVATGIIPFAYIPTVLQDLPDQMVSHSSSHSDLSAFRGQRVGVVGRGQSALETAAILHEQGADVDVLARGAILYNEPVAATTSLSTSLRTPVNPLCETWHCWGYYTLPDVFRALPKDLRIEKARTVLGPSASWWLKPRLEGRVSFRTGIHIDEARPDGDRVRLVLDGDRREESVYDHVIAGTGFRTDLNRLAYLSPDLTRRLALAGGSPVLSRSFESSVPGLFFVGAMAAPSMGPSMRFISGTRFTAKRLVKHLLAGRRRANNHQPVPPAGPDRTSSPVAA
jgi:thioredoxin reductase